MRTETYAMGMFADLALVRRERAMQGSFRTATPTAAESAAPDDQRLRLHVLVDRERLGLARCALVVAKAVAQFMFEHERNEELRYWANRHKTVVLLDASPADMQELAAYLGKQQKISLLLTDEALDDQPVVAVFQPLPAMEGKVLFGRFAPLAL
jgi:hypothetical protein